MHYVALQDAQPDRAIVVDDLGGGRYAVSIDGRRLELTAQPTGPLAAPTGLDLMLDNAVYSVACTHSGSQVHAQLQGHQQALEVVPLRHLQQHRSRQAQTQQDGSARLLAPMAGRIVSVLVQVGAEVTAGQGLVVLEAMKMENELRAPHAGVVAQLPAGVGQVVDAGTLLCVVHQSLPPSAG